LFYKRGVKYGIFQEDAHLSWRPAARLKILSPDLHFDGGLPQPWGRGKRITGIT